MSWPHDLLQTQLSRLVYVVHPLADKRAEERILLAIHTQNTVTVMRAKAVLNEQESPNIHDIEFTMTRLEIPAQSPTEHIHASCEWKQGEILINRRTEPSMVDPLWHWRISTLISIPHRIGEYPYPAIKIR